MKVLLINNDGGGYADYIEVATGTTVSQLFEQRMRDANASDYLIRVNRQPCPPDQTLEDGDRISITPTKIEGAKSKPLLK
ncbi:MoaD/ThiS family protein [Gimesia maris]|uniref:MoaD/ThiS family protein n=1 Tax=Gimesia maris TaxID=122 RepID=UPI00241C8042|nr:MoaD/ThiS family protein [Gimesia maris]|tara:strand:- start:117 stop:356 length:240 start_codon:yes stop_codon:yes gene_type:complete